MYYNHQQRAGAFPDKFLSMLIDGIDKSKTVIHPLCHASKFTSNKWTLRTNLVGVMITEFEFTGTWTYSNIC